MLLARDLLSLPKQPLLALQLPLEQCQDPPSLCSSSSQAAASRVHARPDHPNRAGCLPEALPPPPVPPVPTPAFGTNTTRPWLAGASLGACLT